jgi:acetoin utilization protein AcuB
MEKPPISQFMTKSPRSIEMTKTLADAQRLMNQYRIRHLPVVSGTHLVGILSERELNLTLMEGKHDPKTTSVEKAMMSDPFAVPPSIPVSLVAKAMADQRHGAAIVVDHNQIVGIFTTVDALRALVAVLA